MHRLEACPQRLLLPILACIGLAGCKMPHVPRPGDAQRAEDARFATLFVQMRLATETWQGQPARARSERQRLLGASGMTLGDFRTRVQQMQTQPVRWTRFWSQVVQTTDSIQKTPQGARNGR